MPAMQSLVRVSFAVALAALAASGAGCALVVDTGGVGSGASGGSTGDGGTAAGSGGAIGSGIGGGGSTGGDSCDRLEGGATIVVDPSVTPRQSYCDLTVQNPPDCPASKPEPGTDCPVKGIECAYASDPANEAFTTDFCGDSWTEGVFHCAESCDPPGPEDVIENGPACGSLPDVPCDQNPSSTDQESANLLLNDLASCCGKPSESELRVWLLDGCAVAVNFNTYDGDHTLTDCMKALLAGRRIDCGLGLSCAGAGWSTVQ